MPDLVTLGESMLRFSTPLGDALERATQLDVNVAGTESNVAVAVSRMGMSAGWLSRLPDNPLGRLAVNTIAAQGVDVSRVVWTAQGRMGTYYLEIGSPPRANRVIYDRANSATAAMSPDDIDWTYVASARVLHLTGITPALSPSCMATVQRAVEVARQHNVLISFDINYRAKLWSPQDAAAGLSPLIQGVQILRMGYDEAQALFGREAGDSEATARALHTRFEAHLVVLTDGSNPAVAFDGVTLYRHNCFPITTIVDPIGAGDAFTAGFLVGYFESDRNVARGLAFGQAYAALKLTYTGDIPWCTRADVEALIRTQPGDIGWR